MHPNFPILAGIVSDDPALVPCMYVCVREKRIGVAAKNRQWGESFLKEHLFYEASFSQLI